MRNVKEEAEYLLIYYVGHGIFSGKNADLSLAIRRTRIEKTPMKTTITAEIVTAYSHCPRKAHLLLCTDTKGIEYALVDKRVAVSGRGRKNDLVSTHFWSGKESKPMLASQKRQPTLDWVAPRFLVGDMEQALAFYGQLGIATPTTTRGLPFSNVTGLLCNSMSLIQHKNHQRKVAGCVLLVSPISRHSISSICPLALLGLRSRRRPGGRKDFGSAIPFALS
jgi:hypothetical protein